MHNHLTPNGLSIRCEKHPAYRAIRKPAVDCEPCQWLYDNKGKLMVCVVGEYCSTLTISDTPRGLTAAS